MKASIRARIIDVTFALVVAVMLVLRAAVPLEAEAPDPDWRGFAIVAGMGLVLLWRRRFPLGVLVASVVFFMTYYMFGFGAIGAMWPLAPALFSAALYGQAWPASVAATATLVGSSAWRLFFENEGDATTLLVVNEILSDAALAAAVILAGAMILSRRRLRSEMDARERAVAAEHQSQARERMSEQRLHIAREVHDVVAHSLAGIGVQAHLAEELVEGDTSGARRAIRSVIDATSEAISQLRSTVGELRGAPAATGPPSVEELVAATVGVNVDVTTHGQVSDLPHGAEAVVRSVVRESLTNTVRHADADNVAVSLSREDDRVTVEIRDDGGGGDPIEGNGLRGMRERVESVGGIFAAGPDPEGGFVVRAEVPLWPSGF